jgi:N-sulfoglucosamine sulfohydrolase
LNAVQSLFAADHKPVEELYDLQSDPHEVKNLASEPAQQDRLLSMRKTLDKWIAETGDKGYIMEDPVEIYSSYFGKKA